jgi:hypothetical protein
MFVWIGCLSIRIGRPIQGKVPKIVCWSGGTQKGRRVRTQAKVATVTSMITQSWSIKLNGSSTRRLMWATVNATGSGIHQPELVLVSVVLTINRWKFPSAVHGNAG